jgi:hypothetical protein
MPSGGGIHSIKSVSFESIVALEERSDIDGGGGSDAAIR